MKPLDQRNTIRVVFFIHALATGSMFTRIPDIQSGLGIAEDVLGLALLGQPIGAILTFLVMGKINEVFGSRLMLLVGLPMLCILIFGMALAPGPLLLFAAFAVFGVMFAVTNVSMNVEADRVEAATGRRLMNSCHAVWSVAQLLAVTSGALARGLGVSAPVHLGAVVPIILVMTLVVVWPMREAPARPHSGSATRRIVALPTVSTLLLIGYIFASSMIEGASRNWSIILMRDSFDAPPWVDSLTLPAFIGATAAVRLFADSFVQRYGPVKVARALSVFALAGLALIVWSPHPAVVILGFALLGVGVCVAFPLTTSAAAQLGDRPAAENVSALTMTNQLLMLGAPAAIGAVAANFDIRIAFALLIPLVLVATYLARFLAPRKS